MPVCPLCNKAVPVPRGEQPDIKVSKLYLCLYLVGYQREVDEGKLTTIASLLTFRA